MDRTVAAIDIGTNTVLLLVAAPDPRGLITPVLDLHRVPRLGAGVDSRKFLHPDSIARAIAVLKEFREAALAHNAGRIIACATSAVRDAGNRGDFIEEVRRTTGLSVEVLSGEEEAILSFHGALSGLTVDHPLLVLDIGGGSTELTWGDANGISFRASFDLGAVRLTERCFHHDPPLPEEIARASDVIDDILAHRTYGFPRNTQLIAVAGTPTTLTTLARGLKTFSAKAIEGYTMQRDALEELWERLSRLPSAEIRALSEVCEGRADVMTAGTLILRRIMDRFGFRSMRVSDKGLRYGLILRELKPD